MHPIRIMDCSFTLLIAVMLSLYLRSPHALSTPGPWDTSKQLSRRGTIEHYHRVQRDQLDAFFEAQRQVLSPLYKENRFRVLSRFADNWLYQYSYTHRFADYKSDVFCYKEVLNTQCKFNLTPD